MAWNPRWYRKFPHQKWHRIKQLVGDFEVHEVETVCGRVLACSGDDMYLTGTPKLKRKRAGKKDARCRRCDAAHRRRG